MVQHLLENRSTLGRKIKQKGEHLIWTFKKKIAFSYFVAVKID